MLTTMSAETSPSPPPASGSSGSSPSPVHQKWQDSWKLALDAYHRKRPVAWLKPMRPRYSWPEWHTFWECLIGPLAFPSTEAFQGHAMLRTFY